MEKKKKIIEAPPVAQGEQMAKEILLNLLRRVKEENQQLDDHMGTIIGDRDRPPVEV